MSWVPSPVDRGRRHLLEEILRERSRAVALLPALEDEPPARATSWRLGLMRAASYWPPRRAALAAAVIALAWLEAIDSELEAQLLAGDRHAPDQHPRADGAELV